MTRKQTTAEKKKILKPWLIYVISCAPVFTIQIETKKKSTILKKIYLKMDVK